MPAKSTVTSLPCILPMPGAFTGMPGTATLFTDGVEISLAKAHAFDRLRGTNCDAMLNFKNAPFCQDLPALAPVGRTSPARDGCRHATVMRTDETSCPGVDDITRSSPPCIARAAPWLRRTGRSAAGFHGRWRHERARKLIVQRRFGLLRGRHRATVHSRCRTGLQRFPACRARPSLATCRLHSCRPGTSAQTPHRLIDVPLRVQPACSCTLVLSISR